MKTLTLTAFMASAVLTQANLITNGSFETPDYGNAIRGSVYLATPPPGFGWSITGSIDVIYNHPSADGDQILDLCGSNAGSVFQDIATTPGVTYYLSFALNGNFQFGPKTKHAELVYGNQSETYSIRGDYVAGTSSYWPTFPWEWHQVSFVANSALTRIRFSGLDDSFCGATLDDVVLDTVARTLPEPPQPSDGVPDGGTTRGLMLASLAGLVGLRSKGTWGKLGRKGVVFRRFVSR